MHVVVDVFVLHLSGDKRMALLIQQSEDKHTLRKFSIFKKKK